MAPEYLPAFEGRMLAVDKDVALLSASYYVPDPRPYRDTLIAATAVVHGLTVVTRNAGDICLDGVRVLNPWEFC